MAYIVCPSAVWIGFREISQKVMKWPHIGEKCWLAPQSIIAPCWSVGTLRALATSMKSKVYTNATLPSACASMAILVVSLFTLLFPFCACCLRPWPSFPLPGLQQSSFQCLGFPQLKHFFSSLLTAVFPFCLSRFSFFPPVFMDSAEFPLVFFLFTISWYSAFAVR